jgi:hypothetical protein
MNAYNSWLKLVDVYFDYGDVAVVLPRRIGGRSTNMGEAVDKGAFSFETVAKHRIEDLRGFAVDAVVIFRKEVAPNKMTKIIRPMMLGKKKRIHFIGDV